VDREIKRHAAIQVEMTLYPSLYFASSRSSSRRLIAYKKTLRRCDQSSFTSTCGKMAKELTALLGLLP
jgi:hypothetical protein